MTTFELQPNTKVGRYILLAPLAQGGMGSVYLARMAGTIGVDKFVAVKVIHSQFASDQSFVSMFLDEGRIASRLNHPNVCTTFDVGVDQGIYYQAMEYLHGEPLSTVLRRCAQSQPDPTARILAMVRIIADACEGLHAAHEARGQDGQPLGIVHRDISPHNIFVTYDGAVKVVDFGVAKAAERLEQTRTGTLKGKVQYFSPEQLEDKPIDRGVDIWAMGICLWEALTMRHLFKRDTDAASMMAILRAEVIPPSQILALPDGLEDLVLKALAKDRANRFATARDLSRELQRVIARSGDLFGIAELGDFMASIFVDAKANKDARLMEVRRESSTLLAEAAEHSTGSSAVATKPTAVAAAVAGTGAWPASSTSATQPTIIEQHPTSGTTPPVAVVTPSTRLPAAEAEPKKNNKALLAIAAAALLVVGGGGAWAAGLVGPPPDHDKDGVVDEVDACPNEAGELGKKGCPNKDHDDDGVLDTEDACPAEKGTAADKGCPVKDVDGDNVPDQKDGCPTEKGPPERQGCPLKDRDNDGVADDADDCPADAGTAADKGCPPKPVDTDSDGIADDVDLCPNDAGVVERNGCSKTAKDSDGDGLIDAVDACPKKKGFLASKGCPDTAEAPATAPTTKPVAPKPVATTKPAAADPDEPPPLVREGTLIVSVKNGGAKPKVLINGKESPQTLTTGIKLPPGQHTVKVVPENGPPEERIIEMRSSVVRTVSFDLGG